MVKSLLLHQQSVGRMQRMPDITVINQQYIPPSSYEEQLRFYKYYSGVDLIKE